MCGRGIDGVAERMAKLAHEPAVLADLVRVEVEVAGEHDAHTVGSIARANCADNIGMVFDVLLEHADDGGELVSAALELRVRLQHHADDENGYVVRLPTTNRDLRGNDERVELDTA